MTKIRKNVNGEKDVANSMIRKNIAIVCSSLQLGELFRMERARGKLAMQ